MQADPLFGDNGVGLGGVWFVSMASLLFCPAARPSPIRACKIDEGGADPAKTGVPSPLEAIAEGDSDAWRCGAFPPNLALGASRSRAFCTLSV